MILKFPTYETNISLPFGYDASNDKEYQNFYTLFDNKHPGVDFEIPEYTQVFSSFAGIVVRSEFHKGMGNTVGIRNGNILALYAHLNKIEVKLGDIVSENQLIGLSGNTGEASTSPHLHFELRDLSKNNLKEMVFEPIFNREISNFTQEFIYKVNTQNSTKNINLLSERYFGSEKYSEKIKIAQKQKFSQTEILPQNFEIIIPNF